MGFYVTEECQTSSAHDAQTCVAENPLRGPIRRVESGYRFYNPELGRWINRDPIEERGGIAIYCFALNAPVNRYDYLGLDAIITLITDITSESDGLFWKLAIGTGEVKNGIISMEDAIKTMEDYSKSEGEKIGRINLSGHGILRGVGAQASGGWVNFSVITEDQKYRLKSILSKDAKLYLYVCDAASGDMQKEFLQNAASDLNICIHGKDGDCNAGPDGGFLARWANSGFRNTVGFFLKTDAGGWRKFEPQTKEEGKCKSGEANIIGVSHGDERSIP